MDERRVSCSKNFSNSGHFEAMEIMKRNYYRKALSKGTRLITREQRMGIATDKLSLIDEQENV